MIKLQDDSRLPTTCPNPLHTLSDSNGIAGGNMDRGNKRLKQTNKKTLIMNNSVKFKNAYLDMLQMVKREYAAISLDNRVNVYTCDNGHQFKTIDVDKGVTPFVKLCPICKAEYGSNGMAKSSFYKDIRPDLKPIIEWYRPSMLECSKLKPGDIDHVLHGGLMFRLIQPIAALETKKD